MGIAQLTLVHRPRRLSHQAGAFHRLGEGDDIADAAASAEHSHHAVKAQSDAAMRRRAILEGFQHIAEAGLNHIRREFENVFKNSLLHSGLMDTDGTAAQLDTVDHDIVMLTAHLLGLGLEQRDVFGHRSRERMVRGVPALHFRIVAQEREIHYPEEIELIGRQSELALGFEQIRAVKAETAQNLTGGEPVLVRSEEDEVTLFDRKFFSQSGFFFLAQELGDG